MAGPIDIKAEAAALGAKLRATNEFAEVYDFPPAITLVQSATILPTGGEPETWDETALRFDVILVASTGDYPQALDWLSSAISTVNETLGITGWGETYLTTANGSDVLAVRVTLTRILTGG